MDIMAKGRWGMVILAVLIISGFVFWRWPESAPTTIEINSREKQEEVGSDPEPENIKTSVESSADDESKSEKIPPEEKQPTAEKIAPAKADTGNAKIIDRLASWGYEKSAGRSIDTVVVHTTYNPLSGDEYGVDEIIGIYKSYGVSPHYLIDRKGNIIRMVADQNIAYHAGESKMPDGRTGVNNFSIGIEVINNKADKFTTAQYGSLNSLLDDLKGKYKIKNILGHSDIASGRKDDPWNIEWKKVDR